MTSEPAPFRVLSLDGGGIRGSYAATYLERVAAGFAKQRKRDALDIGAAFDLIVGTSTGGIIACALALGVPLEEVVRLYRRYGRLIFRRQLPRRIVDIPLDIFCRTRALAQGEAALRQALTGVLGSTTLGNVYETRGIALAIPAVELGQHRAWVFKTPHFSSTNHRDDDYSLVDVCLATTAAPLFRSMAAVAHPERGSDAGGDTGHNVFVDGGLWSNNPVMIGLIEALDVADATQPIEVFCLGTCPVPAGEQIAPKDVHRGLLGWKLGGSVASLAIDAQQFGYDHMARKLSRHLGRRCDVVRFPAGEVSAALMPFLGLDDARDEAMAALVNQARTDANMTNSRLDNRKSDREAALIWALLESAPPLKAPLASRRIPADAPPPLEKDHDDA